MTDSEEGGRFYPAAEYDSPLVHTLRDGKFGCFPVPTDSGHFTIIRCGHCAKVFRSNNLYIKNLVSNVHPVDTTTTTLTALVLNTMMTTSPETSAPPV